MTIKEIRLAIENGMPVLISAHVQQRMAERDISRQDIRHCIFSGEIIEDYPLSENNGSEHSYPSCLISGSATDGRPLHVVVGMKTDILLITVYYPNPEVWMPDYRKRRRKDV